MLWPAVNAGLNAASGLLVLAGLWCIRTKRVAAHRACMGSACGVTTLFFVSYVSYHARVGGTPFPGEGWLRAAYLAILISHTTLAIVIVPLVARTVFLALRNRLEAHKRLARITAPIWLYVSATGIIVYWMLYQM